MTLFDERALQLAVQRHLESVPIPEGKRGAFVTVGNQDGVRAVIAVRVGDEWSVGAFLDVDRHPDDHDWGVDYGVIVKGTF
jgi:hypothetical protein